MTNSKLNKFKIFNFSLIPLLLGAMFFSGISNSNATDIQCMNVILDISVYDQKVSCDVIVNDAAGYGIFLEHFYHSDSRDSRKEFRKILGMPVFSDGKDSMQQNPYSIRLEVKNVPPTENYFMHVKIAPEADIKGKDSVMAELTRVYLILGTYRIEMIITRTSPLLKNIDTKLKFLKISEDR